MTEKALALNTALLARWNEFLRAIAAGVPLESALLNNLLTTAELDLITRTDPMQDQRWLDARLAGEMVAWPALAFEDVCNRVSAGMAVNDAIAAVRGGPDPSFFRVADGIPQRKAQFMAAMRAWTLVQAQQLEQISDDTSRDVLEGPKGPQGNMAAVQRDRLRVDVRKTLLTAFNRELFGDQKASVQVTINNHAEQLEDARARLVRARRGEALVTPQQMREAIDATFAETEDPEPAAPTDAVRNEELPLAAAEPAADSVTKAEASEAENPWKCLED